MDLSDNPFCIAPNFFYFCICKPLSKKLADMIPDNNTLVFFTCFTLVLLGLCITIDLIVLTRRSSSRTDKNRDCYLDSEGNHSYYERSIIEKSQFRSLNPNVPPQELRTIRRFLKQIFR